MSNYLAIATATATLTRLLQASVGKDVPGAEVRSGRPDSAGNATPPTRVNLYLYQVAPNAALRNSDLPARSPDGQLLDRPQLALDLHYLLSFYGAEETLEPQRLLGSAVRTLNARPVLTRQMIRDALSDAALSYLAGSNLADQVELIRFTPLPLTLDELSKLWSVFFQTPYALSVAYQGTVVLIESEETAQPALPVRSFNMYVAPFRQPVIDQVAAQAGAGQPILAGANLTLSGRKLRGEVTLALVGDVEVAPQAITDSRISLTLPAGLRAGVQGVQVVHKTLMGTPASLHRGVESNVAPFILTPKITQVTVSDVQGGGNQPRSAKVTATVNPQVGKSQRVLLLMNQVAPSKPAAFTFTAPSREADSDSITVAVSGVKAGDYVVRIQVDGAQSPLETDTDPNSPTFNQYTAPKATIP